jgi:hypothetical protein
MAAKKAITTAPPQSPRVQLFVARRLDDSREEILAGPFARSRDGEKALDEARAAGHVDAYELGVADCTKAA